MRKTIRTVLAVAAASGAFAAGAFAQEQLQYKLEIERAPLRAALTEFAQQTGSYVSFVAKNTEAGNFLVGPIKGRYTVESALDQIMAGSGLTYTRVDETRIAIVAKDTAPIKLAKFGAESQPARAARAAPGGRAEGGSREIQFGSLEEVIVTATKREERLIDVPQAVAVLSADHLADLGATQFRDFANTVPGLNFTSEGTGSTHISMRGVTIGGGDIGPTVAVYVDEVPYGGSTGYSFSSGLALDVGLFDLDRIEVLRGPQGTLYGASSAGGLLKYVTKKPDATRVSGSAQAGMSGTEQGGLNYNASAVFNAPLVTDKLAVRLSGFESHEGGYIDNVATGEDDLNSADTYGGRADLLFTPTDKLSIRLTGFLQNVERDGESTADYTLTGLKPFGELEQNRVMTEPFENRFQLMSGTLTYDFDWAELTSVTSYQSVHSSLRQDASVTTIPLLNFFGRQASAAGFAYNPIRTYKFAQEVRLNGGEGAPVEWVLGGFYTDENSYYSAGLTWMDLNGQFVPNDLLQLGFPTQFEETAVFGDLTWYLTDQFDVTGGVRYASNDQVHKQDGFGLFGQSTPTNRTSDDVVTYLANARYHFTEQSMLYLRFATGYRPGGPNLLVLDTTTGLPIGPLTFDPDELKSYEIGFKTAGADGGIAVDLAAYYIDWSDIKVASTRGGFSAIFNIPEGARVQGAELTLTARPTPSLTATGSLAYQDAQLAAASADVGGAEGERLPSVPRFTGFLDLNYELPIEGLQPRIGATLRHVSDRKSSFNSPPSPPQYDLPEYTIVDLRTGLTFRSVNVQLYVHNILDERGQISAITSFGTARVGLVQPRTIGISATTQF